VCRKKIIPNPRYQYEEHTMKKSLLLITPILLITGCSTYLQPDQCQKTNWFQVGLDDGIAGKGLRDLTKETEDCKAYSIEINHDAYAKGWANGNREFCSYERGQSIGRKGEEFPYVCQGDFKSEVQKGWRDGVDELCNDRSRARALGKSGKGLPTACNDQNYSDFQSEYEHGIAVKRHGKLLEKEVKENENRLKAEQDRLRELNRKLAKKRHQISNEVKNEIELNKLEQREESEESEVRALEQQIFDTRQEVEQLSKSSSESTNDS
jgi:hypothetical protein